MSAHTDPSKRQKSRSGQPASVVAVASEAWAKAKATPEAAAEVRRIEAAAAAAPVDVAAAVLISRLVLFRIELSPVVVSVAASSFLANNTSSKQLCEWVGGKEKERVEGRGTWQMCSVRTTQQYQQQTAKRERDCQEKLQGKLKNKQARK
jgi:hypothetical protein